MKYFWDFVDFVIRKELNTPDSIMRNYAIDHARDGTPITPTLHDDRQFVRLGLHRLGLAVKDQDGNDTVHTAFGELLAALRSKGLYLNEYIIMGYLAQFYNYHRLKHGELKIWYKNPSTRSPRGPR